MCRNTQASITETKGIITMDNSSHEEEPPTDIFRNLHGSHFSTSSEHNMDSNSYSESDADSYPSSAVSVSSQTSAECSLPVNMSNRKRLLSQSWYVSSESTISERTLNMTTSSFPQTHAPSHRPRGVTVMMFSDPPVHSGLLCHSPSSSISNSPIHPPTLNSDTSPAELSFLFSGCSDSVQLDHTSSAPRSSVAHRKRRRTDSFMNNSFLESSGRGFGVHWRKGEVLDRLCGSKKEGQRNTSEDMNVEGCLCTEFPCQPRSHSCPNHESWRDNSQDDMSVKLKSHAISVSRDLSVQRSSYIRCRVRFDFSSEFASHENREATSNTGNTEQRSSIESCPDIFGRTRAVDQLTTAPTSPQNPYTGDTLNSHGSVSLCADVEEHGISKSRGANYSSHRWCNRQSRQQRILRVLQNQRVERRHMGLLSSTGNALCLGDKDSSKWDEFIDAFGNLFQHGRMRRRSSGYRGESNSVKSNDDQVSRQSVGEYTDDGMTWPDNTRMCCLRLMRKCRNVCERSLRRFGMNV
eukprot:GHVQ01042115.1.p1 GENE.GHVQ01042115.1~~GHVQ01042115.1.p1  ORF type:complete len:522 (+),score=76.25 GHVQ01042115.1:404-1969(+)